MWFFLNPSECRNFLSQISTSISPQQCCIFFLTIFTKFSDIIVILHYAYCETVSNGVKRKINKVGIALTVATKIANISHGRTLGRILTSLLLVTTMIHHRLRVPQTILKSRSKFRAAYKLFYHRQFSHLSRVLRGESYEMKIGRQKFDCYPWCVENVKVTWHECVAASNSRCSLEIRR